MRVLSRLLAALMIAGLMLPAAAVPLFAAQDATSISIKPSTKGPVGMELYLTGDADSDDEGWAYFQIADDEWVKVLDDSDDWDFDSQQEGEDEWYEYTTDGDMFTVPECVGGAHTISIVNDDLGNDVDDDEDIEDAEVESKTFTVEPSIEVLSVNDEDIDDPDDAEGPMGAVVEVKGTGFGDEEDIEIFFDGDSVDLVDDITSDEYGSWTGTFIVPAAAAGEHDITAGGDDTDEDDCDAAPFTMNAGINIEPKTGVVGSSITVTGSGFQENEDDIKILFDGNSIGSTFDAGSDGAFSKTVQIPEAAMGTHEIDAEGEDTKKADIDNVAFEVEPTFVMEPTTGNVGTQIEVAAKGLPASTSVTIMYDGVTKGTGTTTSKGTLAGVSFAATHTQSVHTADHTVTATFDSTTLTLTYAMESTAPGKPVPSTPLNGTRIGLLGKVSPTLTWKVVDDPSGVTYGLQISTTPDFSQVLISKTGLIAQGSAIIVSATGPEMSYTLTETESLPYGKYYWRVKAIDGALNDSGWSTSNSFKAGLLPTWALIVIIALAAVLIGALVYVLIIRDRVGLYD
ncbi:MAG: IPT/TIG domain-containing protein [Dehalococcoidia bacterium]|nr:IPT/TIG domain-containing protein [Dehalococcoidia bacterium]